MTRNIKSSKTSVPGTIYLRNKRYWWKAPLPGEEKPKARPLKPVGAKFATTDLSVALEVAQNIWQEAIFHGTNIKDREITNIASLTSAYLAYVDEYYIDENGKPTCEPQGIRYSVKPLVELFANLPVEDFGPLRLINVRDHMISVNLCRRLINQRIGKIKRMFKWGVCRQAISPVIYQGLMAVEGLKRGRSAAKELPKRKPVSEDRVYAVLPYTTPVISAMVQLQLLTSMRPGELVIMRPCDIDRSGEIWHYYPEKHKNQYRGTERIVSIGPKGQQLLRPYLLRPEDSFCFSPTESEDQRRKAMTERRKTPLSCGNKAGTNRKENPKNTLGNKYDTSSYRKAIGYAVRKANIDIKKKAQLKGIEPKLIPNWTPYQLRHTAATKVRREMGYESAGAALGHTNMSATAIYAERNQGLADEAAKKFG